MVASVDQFEPTQVVKTIHSGGYEIDIKPMSAAIKDLIVYAAVSFVFSLPFVGFFAGVGVNVFRWITGL